MIASDCVELLPSFIEASGVKVSRRDLISSVGANQGVLIGAGGFRNLAAGSAIRENQILRRNPISYLRAIRGKSLDTFVERGNCVIEGVFLAVKKALVLMRFFAIAKRVNFRRSRESGYLAPGVGPFFNPGGIIQLTSKIEPVVPKGRDCRDFIWAEA